MFWKKKKVEKTIDVFNSEAFNAENKKVEIKEPMTIAKYRIENGAQDYGYDKAVKIYNNHKVKIQNQWINPLESVNAGWGNAHGAIYLYQPVNYYECYALAQDPLFNKIFNILSETPFANGGEVAADFTDEQTELLEKASRKYKIREKMIHATRSNYVSGGCLVYMDFGLDDLSEPLDLKKMDMKRFRGFRHIDPINVTAIDVNTSNPAEADYMKPKTWYVVGLGACHNSHFLKFEDNEPELMMKPMCMYFGMPLTLLIKQDVANSNLASQGLANLINRFRYMYLTTSNENFTGQGAYNFRNRLEAMSALQDNFQLFALKQDEKIEQFTTSLAGMQENTEFFYQILAAKTDITMSILMCKSASGLSGTLEGERRNFYDRIRTIQTSVKDNLIKMLGIAYGAVTDGKFYEFEDYIFNPLEQSNEREKAENIRSYMEVAKGLIEMGCKQEDVLNWLKKFKDFHLDNIEFDEDTGDLIDYENGEGGIGEPVENTNPEKFAYVMREFKEGKLKTPDGKVVTDPEQAKAIAYSESEKE